MKTVFVISLLVLAIIFAGCTSGGPSTAAQSAPQVQTPPSQQPSAPTVKAEAPKPAVPADCNPLKDNACTTLNVGQEAVIGGQLKLTLSGIKMQTCEPSYGSESTNYLVFDVSAENVGSSGTVYVGANNFYILDANKNQIDASIIAYPATGSFSKTQECIDAKNSALDTSNLGEGSKSNGKVWIELKKALPNGDSYLVFKPLIGNTPVFFKFNNAQ